MATLQTDLREFVALLNSHEVEYLVIGGHAVAFHGYPRYTGDIDFLIRTTSENAGRVMDVLAEFGFGDVGVTTDDLTVPGRIVQLGLAPNRIDLLTSISGVDFDSAWSGRSEGSLDGLAVSFLGRDELLENKRASGRLKDQADVAAILALLDTE